MLKDKKILLFVSGSIAVYKILSLIRLLRKEGALVRVIATKSALKFITPLSFETLCGTTLLHDNNETWTQDSTTKSNPARNHIGYAKWADLALFAPATANSINKLALGIADTIYLASALALPHIPKLLAPSANTFMLQNPTTQKSLQILEKNGYSIVPAVSSLLACGDVGNGAMASIENLLFSIKRALFTNAYWRGKKVIITGGGSSEDIDSVRTISNNSSGLQASYLALALYYLGADIHFITSKTPLELPDDIKITRVKSSHDYMLALQESLQAQKDSMQKAKAQDSKESEKIYLFMVAAISDYIPKKREGKLKKQDIGREMILQLYQNEDILGSVQDSSLIKIGFKAECDSANAKKYAHSAMLKKQCHAICLNIISKENKSFGDTHNALYVLTKDSEKYMQGSKFDVSVELCLYLQTLGFET